MTVEQRLRAEATQKTRRIRIAQAQVDEALRQWHLPVLGQSDCLPDHPARRTLAERWERLFRVIEWRKSVESDLV